MGSSEKNVILEEFSELGINLDALMQEVGKDYEPFDLILLFLNNNLYEIRKVNKVIKRD